MDQNKQKTPEYWIKKLKLKKHPEGGCFREIARSEKTFSFKKLHGCSAERSLYTSIFFFLKSDDFSCFHRLKSDEIWHFLSGSPLHLYIIDINGNINDVSLGNDPENGEIFYYTVKRSSWFAAKVCEPSAFALVSCTVVPGFEYEDFEVGKRSELLKQFPQHKGIIEQLTRNDQKGSRRRVKER